MIDISEPYWDVVWKIVSSLLVLLFTVIAGRVIDRLLNRVELVGDLIGDRDAKLLAQRDHQHDLVEVICAEIIGKGGLGGDVLRSSSELFGDNLLHPLFDVHLPTAPTTSAFYPRRNEKSRSTRV